MIRAAGALRKQQDLDTASAPWLATELHAALPIAPAQTIALEEADQHANVLSVHSR